MTPEHSIEVLAERLLYHGRELERHNERIGELEKMVYKINGIGVLVIVIIELASHFIPKF